MKITIECIKHFYIAISYVMYNHRKISYLEPQLPTSQHRPINSRLFALNVLQIALQIVVGVGFDFEVTLDLRHLLADDV